MSAHVVGAVAWALALGVLGAGDRCDAGESDTGDEAKAQAPESEMVITTKPMVVDIALGERLRSQVAAALDSESPRTVRLVIRGVTPPERPELAEGIKVFVNKPDATVW